MLIKLRSKQIECDGKKWKTSTSSTTCLQQEWLATQMKEKGEVANEWSTLNENNTTNLVLFSCKVHLLHQRLVFTFSYQILHGLQFGQLLLLNDKNRGWGDGKRGEERKVCRKKLKTISYHIREYEKCCLINLVDNKVKVINQIRTRLITKKLHYF